MPDVSETYTKLFGSITDSTIWTEDNETRLVWITMLAMCDQHGYVGASLPGLAARARVSLEGAKVAIGKFLSPDEFSRSKEYDGRRIEVTDRGWNVLNYERFRDMRDEESRKEYERNRKRESRKRAKEQNVPDGPARSLNVPQCLPQSAQAEAEAHTEVKEEKQEAVVKSSEAANKGSALKQRPLAGYRRLRLFRWMVEELIGMLGDHVETFDLEGWLQAIDSDGSIVIPALLHPWLKLELEAECKRRGLFGQGKTQACPSRDCLHSPPCPNPGNWQCQQRTVLEAARAQKTL